MNDIKRPINMHKAYHAHVYFDKNTIETAKQLCTDIDRTFNLKLGRFHEKRVGPHPMFSCQITFGTKHFDDFIPWLDKNRKNLTIFVHPLTGDDILDHTRYAYWLGQSVELNLACFGI